MIVCSIILVIVISTTTFVVLFQQPKEYDPHGPIIILKDKDFKYYGFPGKGTRRNPYLIQNYNITTNHTECIYISETTKHFVIQNCYLISNTQTSLGPDTTGIRIENVKDDSIQIIGNEIHGVFQGIKIVNSRGPIIENNNISIIPYECYAGPYPCAYSFNTELINCENSIINNNNLNHGELVLFSSNNSIISKNSFECRLDIEGENIMFLENTYSGTLDITSPNAIISKNTFRGTYLEILSPNVTISENIFIEGGHLFVNATEAKISDNFFPDGGLVEVDSQNCIISDNQIFNGGYAIYDASSTVENNLVNNKQLGFFAYSSHETFSSDIYGQYNFVECYNIIIRDLEISNTSASIFIASSDIITMSNNKLSYADIAVFDSSYINIVNNTFNVCRPYARRCVNVNIIDNIVHSSTIQVSECLISNIINNTAESPGMSVYLWYSSYSLVKNNNFPFGYINSYQSYHGIISNNIIISNYYGIVINNEFGSYTNNTIDNNNITTSLYPNWGSICLNGQLNITVSNNVMNNGIKISLYGYELSHLQTLKIMNNTNNGKLIGFYFDEDNLVLSSQNFSQLYLIYCNNIEVRNQTMNMSNEGMSIFYCNNITLENNYLNNTESPLIINYTTNLTMVNNTITSGKDVEIRNSENCIISENSFSNGDWCTLRILYSVNCLIMNNSFANCFWFGLILNGAINCTIKYNLFMLNAHGGLSLDEDTQNGIIHHNAFIDNNSERLGNSDSQASDWGENNIWYDELLLEGNFWSNWSGVGPYGIRGGSEDPYPLLTNPL